MGVKPCSTCHSVHALSERPIGRPGKIKAVGRAVQKVVSMTATDYPTRSLGFRPIALLG